MTHFFDTLPRDYATIRPDEHDHSCTVVRNFSKIRLLFPLKAILGPLIFGKNLVKNYLYFLNLEYIH